MTFGLNIGLIIGKLGPIDLRAVLIEARWSSLWTLMFLRCSRIQNR